MADWPTAHRRVYDDARAAGLSDDAAKAAVAVAYTEGGYGGRANTADPGMGSAGTFQLNFSPGNPGYHWAEQLGASVQDAWRILTELDPFAADEWWFKNGLGPVLKQGESLGLRGADLATYGQQHGQRSVDPWKAGQNYDYLFGADDGTSVDTPGPQPAPKVPGVPDPAPDTSPYPKGVQVPGTQTTEPEPASDPITAVAHAITNAFAPVRDLTAGLVPGGSVWTGLEVLWWKLLATVILLVVMAVGLIRLTGVDPKAAAALAV